VGHEQLHDFSLNERVVGSVIGSVDLVATAPGETTEDVAPLRSCGATTEASDRSRRAPC